jgi:acetolactate synthase-1/2/3 large subunit
VLSIGSRFDDRIIGQPARFCRNATRIHIDIDPGEFGRMIPCHIYCLGDARRTLEELLQHVGGLDTSEWLAYLNQVKARHPLSYRKRGGLKMQHVLEALSAMTRGEAIVVTDVGQHQMWAAQFCKVEKPNTWISSGGAGTMGFGLPAAIGAQFGQPRTPVWAIVGDGGFQMTMAELATAAVHKLPVKVIVMNNRYLGMVRQWQTMFYEDRKSGVDLDGNPDFARLAECYAGVRGFNLRRAADIRRTLTRAMEHSAGPCVINADVEKADNVFPMVPAGAPLEDMLIRPPKATEEES